MNKSRALILFEGAQRLSKSGVPPRNFFLPFFPPMKRGFGGILRPLALSHINLDVFSHFHHHWSSKDEGFTSLRPQKDPPRWISFHLQYNCLSERIIPAKLIRAFVSANFIACLINSFVFLNFIASLVEKAGFALHNDIYCSILRNLLKNSSFFSLFSNWPAEAARLVWLAGVLSQFATVRVSVRHYDKKMNYLIWPWRWPQRSMKLYQHRIGTMKKSWPRFQPNRFSSFGARNS